MKHGSRIYAKSSDMVETTMFEYPQSNHELPHWNYVLRCCVKCPSMNLPDQKIDYQYSNTSTSIGFHINHLIACCTAHERLPLTDKRICCKCKHDSFS